MAPRVTPPSTVLKFQGRREYPPEKENDDWGLTREQQARVLGTRCMPSPAQACICVLHANASGNAVTPIEVHRK